MSLIIKSLLVCVLCVALYRADDLYLGSTVNTTLAYQETVKLGSIPLSTRVKNVFYNSNNTRIIKAITAVDIEKSKAKTEITAGGIGASFVNLRLRSERGKALSYLVQVFV